MVLSCRSSHAQRGAPPSALTPLRSLPALSGDSPREPTRDHSPSRRHRTARSSPAACLRALAHTQPTFQRAYRTTLSRRHAEPSSPSHPYVS